VKDSCSSFLQEFRLPGLFNPHAGPYLLHEELPLLLIRASPLPGGHQDQELLQLRHLQRAR